MNDTTAPTTTEPEFSPELEARIRAHEAKRANRIARLRNAADSADARGNAAWKRSDQMASVIPFGQPILVGHHSEGRDRRFRDRIHRLMYRGIEEHNKAKHLRTRAEAAEDNRAIMSDDPIADRKLAEKIAKLEAFQKRMVEVNATIRAHRTETRENQIAALVAIGCDPSEASQLLSPDFAGRIGFPAYALSNNSANVRRLKQRHERVSEAQATPATEIDGANGIRFEDSPQDNRVRLYFPGKPDASVRANLKARGFRWTPTLGAWQAYRNAWTNQTAREIAGLPAQ